MSEKPSTPTLVETIVKAWTQGQTADCILHGLQQMNLLEVHYTDPVETDQVLFEHQKAFYMSGTLRNGHRLLERDFTYQSTQYGCGGKAIKKDLATQLLQQLCALYSKKPSFPLTVADAHTAQPSTSESPSEPRRTSLASIASRDSDSASSDCPSTASAEYASSASSYTTVSDTTSASIMALGTTDSECLSKIGELITPPFSLTAKIQDRIQEISSAFQVFSTTTTDAVWLAFDIEVCDNNTIPNTKGLVKELGISWRRPGDDVGAVAECTRHFIVKGRQHWKNEWCDDHTNDFHCGARSSSVLALEEIKSEVMDIIRSFEEEGLALQVFGWALGSDVKWIEQFGLGCLVNDFKLQDLAVVWQAPDFLELLSLAPRWGNPRLQDAAKAVELPTANLHNAGHDAQYTLQLARKMSDLVQGQENRKVAGDAL